MRGAHLQSRFELDAGHTAFTATRDARLTPHHTENLNTPRLVADDTQKTVWKWEQQEPFGAGACNPDPDGDNVQFEFNLRFPGQYFDRETNLHYNYFRDYDSGLGRYAQSDPIGLRGGLNSYAYTRGDPLGRFDSQGQMDEPAMCGFIQCTFAYAIYSTYRSTLTLCFYKCFGSPNLVSYVPRGPDCPSTIPGRGL